MHYFHRVLHWKAKLSDSNTTDNIAESCGSRHASLSDADFEELILKKDSKNTRSVIGKGVKQLNEYCKEKKLAYPEQRSNEELDELLGQFYAEVRKQDGDFYCKKSMQATRYGLQRHFDATRNVDIVKDSTFKHSNTII